jgi:hypothetical protein
MWNKIQRSLVSYVEEQTLATTEPGDRTVFIHTKIALLAFVIPFAASAAIANDLESTWKEQTANAFTCPRLEGYLRGFSRNLTIACPFLNTSYGRVHSGASNRFYYESCRCDFGNNNRECAPITSCYAERGRCRGSCPSQSGFYPYPLPINP